MITSRIIRKMAVSGLDLFPNVMSRKRNENFNCKTIYLTFDDGPDVKNTLDILYLLNKYNAKATFFYIGNNLLKYRTIAENVHREKHSIQNHSMTHRNFGIISPEDAKQELLNCRNIIKDISGDVSNKLFRPPYGLISFENISVAKSCGEKVVFWSIDRIDKDSKFNSGDIILLHEDDFDVINKVEIIIDFTSRNGITLNSIG